MAKKTLIECPNCKFTGEGKIKVPGTFALELILYFFFIVPGIAYTIWRKANMKPICPQCSFEFVIKK